jgi:predicted anti-sigma-YlaC factor YlaD
MREPGPKRDRPEQWDAAVLDHRATLHLVPAPRDAAADLDHLRACTRCQDSYQRLVEVAGLLDLVMEVEAAESGASTSRRPSADARTVRARWILAAWSAAAFGIGWATGGLFAVGLRADAATRRRWPAPYVSVRGNRPNMLEMTDVLRPRMRHRGDARQRR